MATRITPLKPEDQSADQRELYQAITGGPRANGPQHFALTAEDGALNGPFDAFLLSPAVGAALQELGATIRYKTAMSDRCRELAILFVAAHRESTFERESHEAIARAIGFAPSELLAIRELNATPFTGVEGIVAQTVLELLDGDLSNEQWDAASTALGAAGVFELTTLVGYYSTLALQLRTFRIDA